MVRGPNPVALAALMLVACATRPQERIETELEHHRDAKPVAVRSSTEGDLARAAAKVRDQEVAIVTAPAGPDFLRFPPAADSVVASVGYEELRKSQVFDYMLRTYPSEVRAAVAVMLSNRILASECARHGITIDEREIDQWYAAHRAALLRRVRADLGSDATLAEWLRLNEGRSETEYERAARDRERAARLLARLVRYHEVLEDRVRLRIISVTDRALAVKIRRQIDEGADFAALARRSSIHPSAESGGMMHPVWRLALHPALDSAAFGLPVGAVSDVIEVVDRQGRRRYQIIKVVGRHPGRDVPYAEVADEIATSLAQEPLREDEWLMWQIKTERLARVRLQGL